MRALPVVAGFWAAGGVLVAGAVWAGTILRSAPADTGPDIQTVQALAERISAPPTEEPLAVVPPSPARRATVPPVRAVERRPVPAPGVLPPVTPVITPPQPAPQTTRRSSVRTSQTTEREDPVKNIALMGVTFSGGKDVAWLVDLSSRERELAGEGQSAFGFHVESLEPDRVVLSRGGTEYSLRLGEKPMQMASALRTTEMASNAGMSEGGFGGFGGREGSGGRSGFGNFGGGAPGMGRSGFSGFSGRGGFGGRSGFGGGGSFFGGNSSGGSSAGSRRSSSSSGGRSSGSGSSFGNRSQSGGGFSSSGGRTFGGSTGGGFRGGGFGGGFVGGSQSGSTTSTFAAGATGGSSNPQTARRQGGRSSDSPEGIVNPQTQRRTGATNQPAFGQVDGTVRGQSGGTGGVNRSRPR